MKPAAHGRSKRVEPPTWRRQFNESWCDPNGHFAPVKAIAIASQIALLYYFGRWFEKLMDQPESLLIVLSFLIAPDVVKKLITMKYGNGNGKAT
jgi:hypothetical protein